MKRQLTLLAAGLMVLTVAAPVVAAPSPDHNKNLTTYLIDCGDGPFTVNAKATPGWTDVEGIKTPIQFRAASAVTVWVDGAILFGPFEITAPPGLESKLVPCSIDLVDGDPAVFDIEFVDAMFTFPRPWDTNGS